MTAKHLSTWHFTIGHEIFADQVRPVDARRFGIATGQQGKALHSRRTDMYPGRAFPLRSGSDDNLHILIEPDKQI